MNKIAPTAGDEEIRLPAAELAQCTTFWDEPVRLMSAQRSDGNPVWCTLALHPWNAHVAKHPVYSAQPGDMWCDEDPDGVTFWQYLGTYQGASVTEAAVLLRRV